MTDAPVPRPRAGRTGRAALLAAAAFVVAGAGLPAPTGTVLIVDPAAPVVFTCVLHREGIAGPGVGVLTLVTGRSATR